VPGKPGRGHIFGLNFLGFKNIYCLRCETSGGPIMGPVHTVLLLQTVPGPKKTDQFRSHVAALYLTGFAGAGADIQPTDDFCFEPPNMLRTPLRILACRTFTACFLVCFKAFPTRKKTIFSESAFTNGRYCQKNLSLRSFRIGMGTTCPAKNRAAGRHRLAEAMPVNSEFWILHWGVVKQS